MIYSKNVIQSCLLALLMTSTVLSANASPTVKSEVIPRWNCSALPNTDSSTSVIVLLHTNTKNPHLIPGYLEIYTGDQVSVIEPGVLRSGGYRFDSQNYRLVINRKDSSKSILYKTVIRKIGSSYKTTVTPIESLNCSGVLQEN